MSQSSCQRAQEVQAAVLRCTCFNLRKAARAVTQMYDEFLRPAGIRCTQFSLLMLIRGMGPIRISDLAEKAVMDRTTLKRNLELLQQEGLVRVTAGADARVREVSLTAAAEKRLAEALPLWQRAQTHITGQLGATRSDRLLGDLAAAIKTTGAPV
jgi:DNA-binding MarR family transcriptional regulator